MSKPIFELVDELPTNNLTVKVLKTLDYVVPGQWDNLVGFKNTIIKVTGETDESMIQQIGDRAVWLFNDKSQGYQRALWLYQTIDSADNALGKIPLMGGLIEKLTPAPEKAQTIDLTLKLVTELVAFCQINGIPGDSIDDFVASLGDYSGESLMRMAALVCLDGLIPLGGSFIRKVESGLLIPGGNTARKLDFIGQSFDSTKGWMSGFVSQRSLSQQGLLSKIQGFIDFSADKLVYVGAFLDMTTNYYEHTGIQTLARRLIERAVAEI
ncbi:MAG: hypothetical protein LW716_14905 [Microcystis sp. 53602_E8]|nr:hypothetical protein [Microcystis sp. 53602_E8]